jgi:Domain of unknown function (DUF4157)
MRTLMRKRASSADSLMPSRAAKALAAASIAQRRLPPHDISRVPIADIPERGPAAQLRAARTDAAPSYSAPNRTGLPDTLKAGLEERSGLSMDQVRVHYGSAEPAQLNAHAFTRGTDIHLAPGQERHLPHEAWHVVQQAQRRVRPTIDVHGVGVNDDPTLEREADTLGQSSATDGANAHASGASEAVAETAAAPTQLYAADACVQRIINIKDGALKGLYKTKTTQPTKDLTAKIETAIGKTLKIGWKKYVRELAGDRNETYKYDNTDEFLEALKDEYGRSSSNVRPNFPKSAYKLGAITREIQTGKDQSGLKPSEEDLALPHRFPFNAIKKSTKLFIKRKEKSEDLERWSNRLIKGTEERRDLNLPLITDKKRKKEYEETVNKQLENTREARKKLKEKIESGDDLELTSSETQEFLKQVNALHGNVPDFGPHKKVNIRVSDRIHLNIDPKNKKEPLSPGSMQAVLMSPHRGKGIARTSDGKYIVTTYGGAVDPEDLEDDIVDLLNVRGFDDTNIEKDDLDL